MTTTDRSFQAELLYCGQRFQGSKAFDLWLQLHKLTPEMTLEDIRKAAGWYGAKKRSYVTGGVYECKVEVPEDNPKGLTLYMGTLAFKSRLSDERVKGLEAETYAEEQTGRRARLEKKLMAEPMLAVEVRRLAQVYSKLSWQDRGAFTMALAGLIEREARNA